MQFVAPGHSAPSAGQLQATAHAVVGLCSGAQSGSSDGMLEKFAGGAMDERAEVKYSTGVGAHCSDGH